MARHMTFRSRWRTALAVAVTLAMATGCTQESDTDRPPQAPVSSGPAERRPGGPGPDVARGPETPPDQAPTPMPREAAPGAPSTGVPSPAAPGPAAEPPPAPPPRDTSPRSGSGTPASPPVSDAGSTGSAPAGPAVPPTPPETPPATPGGPSRPEESPPQPSPAYRDAALLGALASAAPAVERVEGTAWRMGPADALLGWWPSPGGTRLAVTYEAPVALPGGEDVRAVGLAVLDLGQAGPAPGPLRPLLAAAAYGYGPTAPGEAAPALTLTPAGWLDEDRLVVLAPVGGAVPGGPVPGEGGNEQPVYPWPGRTTIAAVPGESRPARLAATAPAPDAGGGFYESPGLAVVEVDVARGTDRQVAWVPMDSFGDVLGRVWLTQDRRAVFLVQGTGLVRVDLGTGAVRRPRATLPPGKFSGVPEVEPVGDGWRLLFGQEASGPVRLLDLETGGVAVLTPEGVVLPTFHAPVPAPDGRRFAYLVAEPGRPYVRIEGEDGDFVLSNAAYVLSERGSRLARLAPPDGRLLREASWSPDGRKLVLVGAGYRERSRGARGDWELTGGPLYLGTLDGNLSVLWNNPAGRVVTVNWLGPDWLILYDQGPGSEDGGPRPPLLLKAAPGEAPQDVPQPLRGRDFPVPFMSTGPWVVGQGADNRLYRFRPGEREALPIEPVVEGWILDWVSAGPWLILKVQPGAGGGPGYSMILEGRYLPELAGARSGRAGRLL